MTQKERTGERYRPSTVMVGGFDTQLPAVHRLLSLGTSAPWDGLGSDWGRTLCAGLGNLESVSDLVRVSALMREGSEAGDR